MEYKILKGDAKEKLKSIDDLSIDCIVTSPPYWQKREYEAGVKEIGNERTPEEYISNITEVFTDCHRVLKKTGNLFLNIDDTFGKGGKRGKAKSMCLAPEQILINLAKVGYLIRGKYIWLKKSAKPESVNDRLSKTYEMIYHLSKSKKAYGSVENISEKYDEITIDRIERFIATKEDKRMNRKKHYVKGYDGGEILLNAHKKVLKREIRDRKKVDGWLREKEWWDKNFRKNPGDVLVFGTALYKESHFAVFNIELPLFLLNLGCPIKQDSVVLDPFAGTGTVLEAAAMLGLNAIGIELCEEYIPLIIKRLDRFVKQRDLFKDNRLIVNL